MMGLLFLIRAYGEPVPFVLTFSTTDSSQVEDVNILAGYITTADGTFVDTIGLYSTDAYIYMLERWRLAAQTWSYLDVAPDAYMGATRPSFYFPDPVVFNWDLRDKDGVLVPDGEYKVHLEIVDREHEEAYGSFSFVKDGNSGTRNVSNFSQFTGISVVYTAAVNPDADNDGMPDAWEIAHGLNISTNDAALDPDGDLSPNYSEYVAGTHPTNSASVLSISHPLAASGSEQYLFQWSSVSGKTYGVQSSTNVTSDWGTVVSNLFATPPTNVWSESYGGSESKFYRLIVLP